MLAEAAAAAVLAPAALPPVLALLLSHAHVRARDPTARRAWRSLHDAPVQLTDPANTARLQRVKAGEVRGLDVGTDVVTDPANTARVREFGRPTKKRNANPRQTDRETSGLSLDDQKVT